MDHKMVESRVGRMAGLKAVEMADQLVDQLVDMRAVC